MKEVKELKQKQLMFQKEQRDLRQGLRDKGEQVTATEEAMEVMRAENEKLQLQVRGRRA